jgi:hypothetical protein
MMAGGNCSMAGDASVRDGCEHSSEGAAATQSQTLGLTPGSVREAASDHGPNGGEQKPL